MDRISQRPVAPTHMHKRLAHVASSTPQPIVFLTCATHERKQVLNRDAAHVELRGLWERSADLNGWFVGDYVLMPDHLHLFARAAVEADPLRKWVAMWKSVSARHLGPALGIEPPLWQRDYFDRFLRSGENYGDKWAYVEANPVRAGLANTPRDWPYRGRIHDLTG